MMISPETYTAELEDKPYPDLIRERDRMIQYLHDFEKKETAGDRSDPEWGCSPSPEVRYQMYLEYLSALCDRMQERYNEEYVWGKRTLRQDAEENGGGS